MHICLLDQFSHKSRPGCKSVSRETQYLDFYNLAAALIFEAESNSNNGVKIGS